LFFDKVNFTIKMEHRCYHCGICVSNEKCKHLDIFKGCYCSWICTLAFARPILDKRDYILLYTEIKPKMNNKEIIIFPLKNYNSCFEKLH
jgi:hypothetical protein